MAMITYLFIFISAANLAAGQLLQPPPCIQVCLGTGQPEATHSPSISRRHPQKIDVTDPLVSSGCNRTLTSWQGCACEWLKRDWELVRCASSGCRERELREWVEELGIIDVCGEDVFPELADGDGDGDADEEEDGKEEDGDGKGEDGDGKGDGPGKNETETDSDSNGGGNQTETDNGNDEEDEGNTDQNEESRAASIMSGAAEFNSGLVALVLGVGLVVGL